MRDFLAGGNRHVARRLRLWFLFEGIAHACSRPPHRAGCRFSRRVFGRVAVLDDIATLVLCRATREEELAGHLPGADAIMLFHDIPHLGEASFARAPRCKCVVRAGVGYNNVDLAAASRHGVIVCNVPDYGTEEVADHAIMFLLALVAPAGALPPGDPLGHLALPDGHRNAPAAGQDVGRWSAAAGSARQRPCGPRHWDWTWSSMIRYLRQGMDKALGIRRVYSLDELLEQSHFVSLHCYLDATTHHLINKARRLPGCARARS